MKFLEFPGIQWLGLHASSVRSSGTRNISVQGAKILQAVECSHPSTHPPPKKTSRKEFWNCCKWLVLKSQVWLVYTQSAKNGWCQFVREDSPPPGKLPTGGVAWLILTPVTLPATFSSVLLYWKKLLPCTISSLPSTQELCYMMVSSFKGSLSGNHWKAAQVKGEFSKFQKLWIAALLFNSSVTLKNVTNTKEKDMETHSSILSWKSHGQRSLVGYNHWSQVRNYWTNLAFAQAYVLIFSNMGKITVVFHRTTVWINESILQEA